jgi:hypothetical protein
MMTDTIMGTDMTDLTEWVLVRVEPTREMIDAGIMFGTSPNKAAIIFQSMCNASPSPPVDVAGVVAKCDYWRDKARVEFARAEKATAECARLREALVRVVTAGKWWSDNQDSPKSALANFADVAEYAAALTHQDPTK